MKKTNERRDSPLRELEWRWLRAQYDEAAIAQAQAQLRNNTTSGALPSPRRQGPCCASHTIASTRSTC